MVSLTEFLERTALNLPRTRGNSSLKASTFLFSHRQGRKIRSTINGHTYRQDRRWNADKPSAALDPYIPTWLTTSSANHRPANFFFFFFLHSKEIVKSGATSGPTDEHQLQISSSHSLTLSSTNNHQHYLLGSSIMDMLHTIFTLCHSRQINVATWFLVFPIDIENKSTIENIDI